MRIKKEKGKNIITTEQRSTMRINNIILSPYSVILSKTKNPIDASDKPKLGTIMVMEKEQRSWRMKND